MSLKFFKLIIFVFFLIFGINLIIQNFSILNLNNFKISKNGINFKQTPNQTNNKNKVYNYQKNKPQEEITLLNKKEPVKKKNKETLIVVKKNDTFLKIIDPFFDNNKIKNSIINKLNKKLNLKNLKIGQKIYFYKNDSSKINKIILPIGLDSEIILEINSEIIKIKKEKINVDKYINSLEFTISSSLYEDGLKAGIPIPILNDAIRLYSFDIDFQRDIKKNTKFEVSFEILLNTKRENIQYGKIKYINLKIEKKDLEYISFKTDEGFFDYFNRKGKNVKKSLLKTPINGARLSSNFGMRKHPISGFNKLHKGIDFAAPKGTPIYAGGNGVIEYAGKNSGYGKYIRIRHNNEYKTAYGHLSAFKKGISVGKRVNQGDTIGFVGNTGKSTGAHLHYEIIFQNKQINPIKLKLPSGKTLSGSELERFNKEVKTIYAKHLFVLYE